MANGDITYSNVGGEAGIKPFASGTYVGETGVAHNIICGFQPSMIVLHNDTDDTEYKWFKGVAAGSMFQRAAAGDKSLITGGPTVYGDDYGDTGEGFTIPATAAINTNADVIYWEAWR